MRWLLVLSFGLLIASPAAADDAGDMRAAATGFYGVYSTFHPSDGIPDAEGRAKYHSFVSPALEALLTDADAAEQRYAKANKDSPPLVEGDLFSSLFEGATSVSIGACEASGAAGHCAANMVYAETGTKPTNWTDTILLVKTPDGWRVDDIEYGGSWAFGNKGRLTGTLKQVIAFQ
jgi:hypothetical protein